MRKILMLFCVFALVLVSLTAAPNTSRTIASPDAVIGEYQPLALSANGVILPDTVLSKPVGYSGEFLIFTGNVDVVAILLKPGNDYFIPVFVKNGYSDAKLKQRNRIHYPLIC
jgi:hypothetical protein